MPEPIAYVYRKARDHNGRIDSDALGSLIPEDMAKETMDGDRLLYIQQPPSTGTQPGILILMDGEQEMHPGDAAESTPAILDELCENKKIFPQVSVYIPAPQDRIREYACNEEFAYFLNNKLVPLLREPPFGCSDHREQTTIAGTSFGGLAATHAALTYPETFGNVLSQSGAFWWYEGWKGFDPPDGCDLIKMSEQPTPDNLIKIKKNQYIIAENKLWYFDASKRSLETLSALQKKSMQSLLTNLEFEENHPATEQELELITSHTGHTHPVTWASASKTAEHETTKKATEMAWLSKIPPKEGLPINFYLSGGKIEEGKTPSLNGESFPGAITLNQRLSIRLTERGYNVTTTIGNGDHTYGSWQADKPVALQTLLPKPTLQLAAEHEKTKQYRDNVKEMRQSDSGNITPTESSEAEKEKITPLHTTPKPWNT